MPIPLLDQHGLLPPGIWDCTLDEIAATYCWNAHRLGIFTGLTNFLVHEWRPLSINCPILVDGSYVRNKPLPEDVDIVMDLTSVTNLPSLAVAFALRFRHDEFKAIYNVDVWARHPQLPHDLSAFFQYVGDKAAIELKLDSKHPKGILRIQP